MTGMVATMFDHSMRLSGGVPGLLAAFGLAAIGGGLAGARRHRFPPYDPTGAWARASVYFGACLVLSWATGVLDVLVHRPWWTAAQFHDGGWRSFVVVCLAVEVVAYWVVWPIGTRSHGRPFTWNGSVAFGVVWGSCEAQLFLVVWAVGEWFSSDAWVSALLTFVVMSAFLGVWHEKYWDRRVAPEHNLIEWNTRKVLLCHIPNQVVTLTFLAREHNPGLFVVFQIVALAGSTIFMRFPAPRATTPSPIEEHR